MTWILLIIPLTIFIAFPISTISVMGKPLKEKELDIFFGKHFKEYEQSVNSNSKMIHGFDKDLKFHNPFIATIPFSALSKWYISGYGTIFRWSKWHKKLDELYKIKRKEPKKPKLSEL